MSLHSGTKGKNSNNSKRAASMHRLIPRKIVGLIIPSTSNNKFYGSSSSKFGSEILMGVRFEILF